MTNKHPSPPGQQSWAYLFEAKGIQRYIFDSGPLRDLIGASDLVAGLAASDTDDKIGLLLKNLGLTTEVWFSRRAGGAFCLHANNPDVLNRIRLAWQLFVGLNAPGLEFEDAGPIAVDTVQSLRQTIYNRGGGVRQNMAAGLLPTGHPYTAFNPRTGRVVTKLYLYANRNSADIVPADMVTQPQRDNAQQLIRLQRDGKLDRVARRFVSPGQETRNDQPVVFPRNLDPREGDELENPLFPFCGEDRRIAVVHADLSGLGEVFRTAATSAADENTLLSLATAIEAIITDAARSATSAVLLPACQPWPNAKAVQQWVVPARPVLLGGDDITVLVRADLAIPFTQHLLAKIEELSAQTLRQQAKALSGLPPRLSACAGIAILQAGQPFSMASALAESLCSHAKKAAKFKPSGEARSTPYRSFLAFHVCQSTLREEYTAIRQRELTTKQAGIAPISLTGNPYCLTSFENADEPGGIWLIDALSQLAKSLDQARFGRGKLLEVGALLFENVGAAGDRFLRWQKILQARSPHTFSTVLAALARFQCQPDATGYVPAKDLAQCIGPILDALELVDIGAVPMADRALTGGAAHAS